MNQKISPLDHIIITNAKENNLKNIHLNIPKNKLVILTGLSGSGKSTLPYDTLYEKGQRHNIESLSRYARRYLDKTGNPDSDKIEGLPPAIAIDQKTTRKTLAPRLEPLQKSMIICACSMLELGFNTAICVASQFHK